MNSGINKNTLAAIGYITWIGFIIAFVMGDRSDKFVRHHLNQALVINLIHVVGGFFTVIPLVGAIAAGIVSLAVVVFDILGAVSAYAGSERPLPYIGGIHIIG